MQPQFFVQVRTELRGRITDKEDLKILFIRLVLRGLSIFGIGVVSNTIYCSHLPHGRCGLK